MRKGWHRCQFLVTDPTLTKLRATREEEQADGALLSLPGLIHDCWLLVDGTL